MPKTWNVTLERIETVDYKVTAESAEDAQLLAAGYATLNKVNSKSVKRTGGEISSWVQTHIEEQKPVMRGVVVDANPDGTVSPSYVAPPMPAWSATETSSQGDLPLARGCHIED